MLDNITLDLVCVCIFLVIKNNNIWFCICIQTRSVQGLWSVFYVNLTFIVLLEKEVNFRLQILTDGNVSIEQEIGITMMLVVKPIT